jgi:transposase InsO family protein
MAVRVAAMDVRMATALTGGVGNVAEFCRRQKISRATYYKWQARYLAEGAGGLRERPRRPKTSPNGTPAAVEDMIVLLRKQLADDGDYDGPLSIHDRLTREVRRAAVRRGRTPKQVDAAVARVPSRATIARILARRGLTTPQPRKRPRSSYRRFQAARPNEMWQSDWTAWQLGNGRQVAIAATLDDHSRLLAGIGACHGHGTGELVWSVMSAAIAKHGVPMTSLSDNGRVYCLARYRQGGEAAFEINLKALGCQVITSTAYHPQTCGKIERLWQTLKKWLTAHGPYPTLGELNTALAQFADHYNHHRPHRALQGKTPGAAFAATIPARPADRPIPGPFAVLHRHTSTAGVVSAGRYLVSLGARWKSLPVTIIRDGDHIAVYTGNQLIRVLDADPASRYQPLAPTPPSKT